MVAFHFISCESFLVIVIYCFCIWLMSINLTILHVTNFEIFPTIFNWSTKLDLYCLHFEIVLFNYYLMVCCSSNWYGMEYMTFSLTSFYLISSTIATFIDSNEIVQMTNHYSWIFIHCTSVLSCPLLLKCLIFLLCLASFCSSLCCTDLVTNIFLN